MWYVRNHLLFFSIRLHRNILFNYLLIHTLRFASLLFFFFQNIRISTSYFIQLLRGLLFPILVMLFSLINFTPQNQWMYSLSSTNSLVIQTDSSLICSTLYLIFICGFTTNTKCLCKFIRRMCVSWYTHISLLFKILDHK